MKIPSGDREMAKGVRAPAPMSRASLSAGGSSALESRGGRIAGACWFPVFKRNRSEIDLKEIGQNVRAEHPNPPLASVCACA